MDSHYTQTSGPNLKFVYFTSFNIIISLLMLSLSCYNLNRVYKLFGFKDIPMILSILSITLSIVCLITFWCISVSTQYTEYPSFFKTNYGEDLHVCLGFLIENAIFYALMLDLFKWGIFIIATSD